MTKKDKKAIEDAFVHIHEKDPKCSSCIFRTEWEHIGKLLRNILENNQPSRHKGHWIRWREEVQRGTHYTENLPHCKCSECDTEYDIFASRFINYCPNCGADMREEQTE